MTRLAVLVVLSLCLSNLPWAAANADQNQWQQSQQLSQSDWQLPQQSQGQNQWQQPQQLSQSDWQLPQQSQGQNQQWQQPQQLGQSGWQQPQQSLGQSQWQQPQQSLGQSQWQQPYQNNQSQYAGQQFQQSNSTFYGQAQQDQAAPQDLGSQYKEPGAYMNQQFAGNQQQANLANVPPTKTKKVRVHKEKNPERNSDGLKNAAGALGRAMAVGAGIAAPLAGAYLIGKAINRSGGGGYYGNPYGYYRPYPPPFYGGGGMPVYSSPYGGYGYGGGMSSFMHF